MSSLDDNTDSQHRSAARLFGLSIGTVAALSAAGWDLPVAVADEGTPMVINCYQPPQVKPDRIVLTCADATLAVDKIVWNSWTTDGATGHGVEYEDNCVPNCAQGSATYSPVTITLSGATSPDFRYTSAVVTNQNTGRSDSWLSADVPSGSAFGIDQHQQFVYHRTGTTLAVSTDSAFDYDAVRLRVTARVGFKSANPAGLVHIAASG